MIVEQRKERSIKKRKQSNKETKERNEQNIIIRVGSFQRICQLYFSFKCLSAMHISSKYVQDKHKQSVKWPYCKETGPS